jgi:hypothetical protein
MAHAGDVGTEIAPEVADDPELAARLDDLLHRTCHLARALTGAEQAAFKVDLDGDGQATRKFFNLSERYERWRDYRVDPRGFGLHGLELAPGEVVRLTQAEVEPIPPGGASAVRQRTTRRCGDGLPRRSVGRMAAGMASCSCPIRRAGPTSPPRTPIGWASLPPSRGRPWTRFGPLPPRATSDWPVRLASWLMRRRPRCGTLIA